jgi:saccharopine dehydrogenase-like NADP-dependent oxidoreductase
VIAQMPENPVVVVFGAAGAVGASLSRDLATDEGLSLRLVDVDTAAIDDLRSERVEVISADLLDPREATDACRGARLLMNCLSFTFFDQTLATAIDQRADYADLVSEPSAEQAAAAEAAGIVAVPGLGLSPGLTNVIVRHASEEIELDSVEILFAIFREIAPSRGALDTIVWEAGEFSPDRNYFEDGRLVPAGPADAGRTIDFGGDFGVLDVYVRPHPEPKSLPRNFPTIRHCSVRGTWQPELMAELAVLNKYGLLDEENGPRTKEAIWSRRGGIGGERYFGQIAARIEVRGAAGGDRVRRTYDIVVPPDGSTYPLTGTCAGIGVRLLAHRPRDRAGVLEPEVFFDPHEYLERLEQQGVISVVWRDEPD